MKKLLALFFIAVLIIPALLPRAAVQAAETKIRMTANGFEPKEITVAQGDTVTFVNETKDFRWPASNLHPTHELYPEFDPKQGIKPGESWSFTFNKAGAWRMHDHLLPQFSAIITVTGDNLSTNEVDGDDKKQGFWSWLWQGIKNLFYRLTHWGKGKNENNDDNEKKSSIDVTKYNAEVSENSEEAFKDDVLLGSYLKKYGVAKTITHLRLLEPKFGSCHQPAHRAGHIGYALFGDKAFVEYSAECQSGYYHGVMEAYFKEHGAGDLQASLDALCKGGLNNFFEHQCIHGIGHGIMAYENYELPDALRDCDLLPKRQDSCWTGVFMENLSARLASDTTVTNTPVGETDVHVTKYLSSDLQYPCNIVEEQYKNSCYFLQTSRMLQITGEDFKKVAEGCYAAPKKYQYTCFASMGRDVGGRFPTDMAREIKECNWVTDQPNRIECLNGAVQNSFWDPSGQDLALEFCRLLTNGTEKDSCYNTIFERAPQVIFEKPDLEKLCGKAEPRYQQRCRGYIPQ